MKCYACGGDLDLRPHVHEEDVGGVVVRDGSTMLPTCTRCGEVLIPGRDLSMYELRAAALVLREGRRVNGEVLRYARKALGLRQADLAKLLGLGSEWISRWETGSTAATRSNQLAIVALLDDAWMHLYRGEELPVPEVGSADGQPLEAPPLPEMRRASGF